MVDRLPTPRHAAKIVVKVKRDFVFQAREREKHRRVEKRMRLGWLGGNVACLSRKDDEVGSEAVVLVSSDLLPSKPPHAKTAT